MSDLPAHVEIHEEGPREGFQIEPGLISTADKIKLIERVDPRRQPRRLPPQGRLMSRTPLSGLKVLEFSHTVMGPTAGLIFAELGADVVKVEPAPGGDHTRGTARDPLAQSAEVRARHPGCANRGAH